MFKKFIISLNKIENIVNLKNLILVLSFFFLWMSSQFNEAVQDYLAYALIMTVGILHGANDIALIRSYSNLKYSNKKILTIYLLAIVSVLLLFLITKEGALLFFMVISGYHFGEQHFGCRLRRSENGNFLFFTSYGITILFMIYVNKINNTINVIQEIVGIMVPPYFFNWGLIIFISLFLLSGAVLYLKRQIRINIIEELFYLLVLWVCFANASLVWGFAIYFVLWHSLPSLRDQIAFLYGEMNSTNALKYLRSSWVYWLLSILGLILLYVLLKEKLDYFVSVVLFVLAAVTFPHVVVMSKIEHLKNSTEN